MATRRDHQLVQTIYKSSQINAESSQNGGFYNIPLGPLRSVKRSSLIEPSDLSVVKKSFVKYNSFEYQLLPVEIEKDEKIGLVVGQIDSEQWVFIDEILPNGMIDMHGTLKEGDYLIQVGVYSLVGIDVTTALVLIERAYYEGRNTISFVAARRQRLDLTEQETNTSINKKNKFINEIVKNRNYDHLSDMKI